ncbi:MAG: lytic transglycosylase domain-containing protein [Xanthomonadales bacterium]|nr:lytic transglycosylase domain-containing protein [Xanthomonadales bacterium]
MAGARDQQGSVDVCTGWCLGAIMGAIALGCVLLFAPPLVPRAQAGSLYRCVGATGETAYSTTTAGYRQCRKMSGFGVSAPVRSRTAPLRRTSLTLATGAVTTTARSLGADGALPVALDQVQGGVQSDAHVLGAAQVQRASLVNATGTATLRGRAKPVAGVVPAAVETPTAASRLPGVAQPAADTARRGAVYRVVRADGSVEYTNVRPPGSRAGHMVTMLFTYIDTCAACDLHSPIQWNRVPLNLTAYSPVIHAASSAYGVSEALLRAVIHAESAFNPRALSVKGAQGLMQLMPGTARDLGVLDAFDSEQNIRGGARYLGLLLQDFSGDEQLAAAAYNAGPAAVQRYGGVPPYAETRVYVQRVATLRKRYAAAIDPALTARAVGGANPRL